MTQKPPKGLRVVRTPHTQEFIEQGALPTERRDTYPRITPLEDHVEDVERVLAKYNLQVMSTRKVVWSENDLMYLDWCSDLIETYE